MYKSAEKCTKHTCLYSKNRVQNRDVMKIAKKMEKWNSNFDSEENDARPCQRPMERARAGPGSRGHGGRRHGQSPLTTGRSPAEYPGSNRRGLHQAACFVQSRARATGPERRSADRPALKTSRPVSDVTPVDHRPNAGTRTAPKPAHRA